MPPPAISRSSTYLPKIWGNIALGNGSALLAALLFCACSADPEPDRTRSVRVHLSAHCQEGGEAWAGRGPRGADRGSRPPALARTRALRPVAGRGRYRLGLPGHVDG